jgi:voltage-gated anion channel
MMTPIWVFPAYPLLLNGPFAATLIAAAAETQQSLALNSLAVAFCAIAVQGAGCLIALMISAAFIYRLMTQKLPRDMQRPGVASHRRPLHCRFLVLTEVISSYRSVHMPSQLSVSVSLHQCVPA